ncbi:MAG TPA: WD40 repeat domain-containing protein [Planctomycetaceae bacterium]
MAPLTAVSRLVGVILPFLLAATAFAAEPPAAAPAPLGRVTGFPDWVTAVAFSPDGKMLAAGTYDEVRLIAPDTREVAGTLKTRNGYIRGVAFSPDGSRLAVGDYQSLSLWEAGAARRVKTFAGHTGYVTAVAFVGDRLLSGSEDGTVRVWDVASGASERTFEIGVPVNDLAVSPDGSLLAVAAGDATRPNKPGPVTLWDLKTGEKVADLVGHERAALAVAFGHDGTRLASAGEDEKVNLHDVPSRKAVGYYAEHSRSVNDVAFLAGDAVLASVSGGNAGGLCELRLWKPDGTDIAAGEAHQQRITSLAVSPDGRTLALGSQDKTVSLWDVSLMTGPPAVDGPFRTPAEAPRPDER